MTSSRPPRARRPRPPRATRAPRPSTKKLPLTSTGYVFEQALEKTPYRRTRPQEPGETIGDALLFGDNVMFGGMDERPDVPWPELLRERLICQAGLRLVAAGLPGRTTRWEDAVLAKRLGDFVKPEDFSGLFHFATLFSSHSPLLVVLALGTNDLKKHVREEIARTVEEDELEFDFEEDVKSVDGTGSNTTGGEASSANSSDGDEQEDDEKDEEHEDEDAVSDADFVAKCVLSLASKARQLFKGHCHAGNLRIIVVCPPPIRLTAVSKALGFDDESVRISKQLPEAFENACKDRGDIELVILKDVNVGEWEDGIHPNAAGRVRIAESIWDQVSNKLPRRPRKAKRFSDELAHFD